MERVRPTAVAIVLCVALLAAACSGDDGGDGAPARVGSPIDAALGIQAVQDFTIHVGLWVAGDDGDPVDFFEPLLEVWRAGAGEEVALEGGYTLAPVTDVAARMVDADGEALSSLSVDLGLLTSTPDALATLPDGLAPIEGDDGSSALLVEVVTADYAVSRDHASPGDRSEIDVTFLDDVQPGDAAATLHLFGQTLPGDAAEEAGLGPLELFAHRWNRGLVRLLGDGPLPRPLIDTALEVREGSTILSREQKGELAQVVTLVAALGPNRDALEGMRDDLFLNEGSASPGTDTENTITAAAVPVPATGEQLVVQCARMNNRESCGVQLPGGEIIVPSRMSRGQLREFVRLYLNYVTCTTVAAVLAANNEAGRRPVRNVLDRFPTTRFVGESRPEGAPTSSVLDEPGADGPEADEPESNEPTPPGCEDPQEPAPDGGGIHGDVRVTTFDGITYGQQAVGEFIVLESDTTVIQMRAEPAGESDRLSIATGFAIGTGGQSVAMHRGERTFINGEERVLERGERVRVGEAEVLRGFFDWTVAWPDGQVVHVYDRGDSNGMMLTVRSAAGPVVGQLGDGNGDPDDDYVTRDGQALPADVVDDFDLFYGTFVESWRIGDEESLLYYDDGESAQTFVIDGFPSTAVTLEDFDPDARAAAEEACSAASVVDDALYEGCVIDVAATGDPGYAYDAFRVQLAAGPSSRSAQRQPDPVDVSAGTPGDTVLTFGAESLVFGTDPPNQRPGGVAPAWNCEIANGDLFAEGSIDLADGPRYAISVQYLAAEPRFSLTVRRTVDDQTTDHAWVLTNVAHFAEAIDEVSLDGSRLAASGEIYVNDPPQLGLAPFSQLPAGATLDPFSLDLDCGS